MTEPTKRPLDSTLKSPLDAAVTLYAHASAASAPAAPPALSAAILQAAAQAASALAQAEQPAALPAQPLAMLMRYARHALNRLSAAFALPSLRYGLPAMMVAVVGFKVALPDARLATMDAAPPSASVPVLTQAAPASAGPPAAVGAASAALPRSEASKKSAPPPNATPAASPTLTSKKGFDDHLNAPTPATAISVQGGSNRADAKLKTEQPSLKDQAQVATHLNKNAPAAAKAERAIAKPVAILPELNSSAAAPAAALPTQPASPFPQASGTYGVTATGSTQIIAASDASQAPRAQPSVPSVPAGSPLADSARRAPPPAQLPAGAKASAAAPSSSPAPAPPATTARPSAAPAPLPAPAPAAAMERPAQAKTSAPSPAKPTRANALSNPSLRLRQLIARSTVQNGTVLEVCEPHAPPVAQVQALLDEGAEPLYSGAAPHPALTTLALAQRCGFAQAAAVMQAR